MFIHDSIFYYHSSKRINTHNHPLFIINILHSKYYIITITLTILTSLLFYYCLLTLLLSCYYDNMILDFNYCILYEVSACSGFAYHTYTLNNLQE